MYILIMKRLFIYIIPCFIFIGLWSTHGLTKRQHTFDEQSNYQTLRQTLPYSSTPVSRQYFFSRGKKITITSRLDYSHNALPGTPLYLSDITFTTLPIDPCINTFTKGIFLKYRPRDPTTV